MDFRKCLVDLSNTDTHIAEAFSALHEDLGSFVKKREDSLTVPTINIIKYVVACYDKESPVVEEFRKRWTIRKKTAATYAGFFDLAKIHAYDVDTILYARNDKVNKIILRYLSMLFDREFLMYAVASELLINVSEQLMRFDFAKPSDMAKAKQNVVELQNDLNDLEEKVFSGGDVKLLKIVLYGEAQRFMVSELRPENIVSKREKKEKIVDVNPYGEGYEVEPLKFISDN
jgi:hypothetical protein